MFKYLYCDFLVNIYYLFYIFSFVFLMKSLFKDWSFVFIILSLKKYRKYNIFLHGGSLLSETFIIIDQLFIKLLSMSKLFS